MSTDYNNYILDPTMAASLHVMGSLGTVIVHIMEWKLLREM